MNYATTGRGDALADKLNPYMGTTLEIRQLCALLTRHGKTMQRLEEIGCNGADNPRATAEQNNRAVREADKRAARLLVRMQEIADLLPEPDGEGAGSGRWIVTCDSIWPKLQHSGIGGPDGMRGGYGDSWGRDGFMLSND